MAPHRAIPERGNATQSSSIEGLRTQLEQLVEGFASERDNFETSPVNGRIYPADSIDYSNGSGLVQGGSSPSYWGGLWSLTCCKHKMRQEHFFDYFKEVDSGVLRPTQPLFVFTCAGKMDSDTPEWAAERRRWLTSIALVTHAFRGMDDYGRFLLEQDEAARKNRLTTQESSEESTWARKKGDCHAVIEGGEVVGVDAPYPEHDHVSSSGTTSCGCSTKVKEEYDHVYHEDNDTSLLKFASTSDYWMSWSEPEFYWTVGNGPDAWGGGQGKRAYRDSNESQDGTVLSELRSAF